MALIDHSTSTSNQIIIAAHNQTNSHTTIRSVRPHDGNLTAASLIDAIITHQINRTTSEPPPPVSRDVHRSNSNNNLPKVINIESTIDTNQLKQSNQAYTKSITIGELTDSIITKDYSPHPIVQLRPPPMQYRLDDTWKSNRLQQSINQLPPVTHVNNSQIINPPKSRMSILEINRSSSPRTSQQKHIIVPSTSHSHLPSQQPFIIDSYVKNRIVEAMRTEGDKRSNDLSDPTTNQNGKFLSTFEP